MSNRVLLVGLDFGSTTTCAMVASAVLGSDVAGRPQLQHLEVLAAPPPIFTPLVGDSLDTLALSRQLEAWLAPYQSEPVFGGGAIVTGLAAERENAAALVKLVRARLRDAVVAVARDPRLEAWLAFMGNAAELSRARPERIVVNLDIGGGTTNIAAGRGGEVLSTGSLWLGARHIQVAPGGYRIVRVSRHGRGLLDSLDIARREGETLEPAEVRAIVDWYADMLRRAATGVLSPKSDLVSTDFEQSHFHLPPSDEPPAFTFSGGVGQLIYAHSGRGDWPPTTAFGDLGIDLAGRLAGDPLWRPHIEAHRPTTLGRATVYGLLVHHTQVSGSSIHVSHGDLLPLSDLPILGTLSDASSIDEIGILVDLAGRTSAGGCLRVELANRDAALVRKLGRAIGDAWLANDFQVPLVLVVRENVGKVLGQYVSDWGRATRRLAVVDEIDVPDAQFIHLGRATAGVVPVSFYGLRGMGDSS